MKSWVVVTGVALAASASFAAHAQEFPVRPLRLIVPYPPGGGTDIMARLVGRKLNEKLGHPVVVDNRPGGNGVIGPEVAARAAPDGHTLLMIISTHTVLPSLQKLSYDLLRDFSPVVHLADLPNVLVARNSLPVSSVADLIALAKNNPDQVKYAAAGLGGPSHLSGALFSHMTGVRMLSVPYKGTGPGMTDVVGGHVDLMFSTMPAAIPHMRSNRVKALAITGLKRAPTLPDLPTIDEAGIKGYEFVSWYGVVQRAGTSPKIVDLLHREMSAILKTPEMRQLMEEQGAQITGRGPAEFSKYLRTEIKRWGEIVAAANIRAQ
jgi:tripartite-type tricarboxylate transporter receptor subunit TctC